MALTSFCRSADADTSNLSYPPRGHHAPAAVCDTCDLDFLSLSHLFFKGTVCQEAVKGSSETARPKLPERELIDELRQVLSLQRQASIFETLNAGAGD